jgi:hypothetical protein
VSFARNVLTIGFPPEFEDHIALVDNSRNHALLQAKMAELGQSSAQVKFIRAERPQDRPIASTPALALSPAPVKTQAAATDTEMAMPKPLPVSPSPSRDKPVVVPFNKDDFKNDPLIQKALEVFKGRIVEVRA